MDKVEEIRLTMPAAASYAHVARLAITGLVARLGYSYDEIEDLRIAVGEVVGALVGGGVGARLTLRCSVTGGAVHLDATRTPAEPAPEITDLTREILQAVVDDVDIDAGRARIRVVKRPGG